MINLVCNNCKNDLTVTTTNNFGNDVRIIVEPCECLQSEECPYVDDCSYVDDVRAEVNELYFDINELQDKIDNIFSNISKVIESLDENDELRNKLDAIMESI